MKHFNEILSTLGASQIDLIHEAKDWDFWKAVYRTPVSNVEGSYLYLKHKCPMKEATSENLRLWKEWSKGSSYEVIVTPGSKLAKNLSQTKTTFSSTSIRTSKQLLIDSFLNNFSWKPVPENEYFIDPDIELPDGRSAHEATKVLSEWMLRRTGIETSSGISVLIANGGVGKTTVARMLCQRLHSKDENVIPILVESDQWRHLIQQAALTMNTVWDRAISRRFDHASRLMGNETALRVLVREELFLVYFDGSDELCVVPGGGFRPDEILKELIELATPEDDSPQLEFS